MHPYPCIKRLKLSTNTTRITKFKPYTVYLVCFCYRNNRNTCKPSKTWLWLPYTTNCLLLAIYFSCLLVFDDYYVLIHDDTTLCEHVSVQFCFHIFQVRRMLDGLDWELESVAGKCWVIFKNKNSCTVNCNFLKIWEYTCM